MSFKEEVSRGERFQFGKNWQSFLSLLDDQRIGQAERSLAEFLDQDNLAGQRFLDIGSGSGLFSLAARRLGAKVQSFDYDDQSLECTSELRRRFYPDDPDWQVEQGSVLDRPFVESLGKFDVCYAWGVLHHTGHLWPALYNAQLTVADRGLLFIGIYNDQGIVSSCWEIIKRAYCSGPLARALTTAAFYTLFFTAGLLIDLIRFRNPAARYREHKKLRGMSLTHDWRDWLGGYPFEPATPQRITTFFENLGYRQLKFQPTAHGFGNNQYLFQKMEV